ncbi:WAP four-disulfide core domain protein 18-like, partial [Mus caroli]|uniref:WAP four-disulfide core domain protein 18-like n=1 Tax=Mus caroli TaxID=10089 RepID=A0A6P5P856_MUSCR
MKTATVLLLVALFTTNMNIFCALSSSKKKPGSCPEHSPESLGICVDLCSGDGSCPGNLKCCSNGCGHACTRPVCE